MATKLNLLKEQLFTWKYAMATTNIDIDDTVQADFIRALQDEIDAEIMFNILKQKGWHHVELDTPVDDQVAASWLSKNASGKHHGQWQNWLFENEKDAVLFSLRWA